MLLQRLFRFSRNLSKLMVSNNSGVVQQCLSTQTKKRVYLHDFHSKNKAKFVNFAGFEMPIQYTDFGISASHIHTRNHCSIFDVSHMLQMKITGKDRVKFMESLVVLDIEGLDVNQGALTVFTNETGGVIDDLIVTKTDSDFLYIVSNAACSEKDLTHMHKRKDELRKNGAEIDIEVINDKTLLAIQGPGTENVLQPLTEYDLRKLTFMTTINTKICGIPDCRITRCGYTGEDGVEISIPASKSTHIIESILSSRNDDVKLAGLGARDTLRLEAGLCLYGNDLTTTTTPVEASLAWTIGKRRRETGGFPGADIILKQLREKPSKRRVGFVSEGPCPRALTEITSPDGTVIGRITSGCPSPCLKKNISMGYVGSAFAKNGTEVNFKIHNKNVRGHVTKMPFVPTKYYLK